MVQPKEIDRTGFSVQFIKVKNTEYTPIDFFDVDHTITRGASGWNFARYGIKRKLFPARALITIPFFYVQYRYGSFSPESFHLRLEVFDGLKQADLEDIALESFEKRLKRDIHDDIYEAIHSIKNSGRMVVLATSSLHIIVKPLADYLGLDKVIATRLEYVDGICTGRFAENPVFGKEKMNRVLQFIDQIGSDVSACSFYSDSYHDIPLLEKVAAPVAVNPDYRLKREAQKRGWKIWKVT